ncbi:Pyrimidine-specific ribonucleoside hydrolase RihB [Paraburkholderia aspalathi]|uniref:Pyrimidine-specific ribonucleoside hydrolase RihB n=1 Tax=Paraburkholderia aspalathi TaxID=1324617 RepID=A0ABM8RRN8_9BURK|nr:nucleoside hydrolase [Paraburkholderia aspalathi]MBK3819971.1 nucleoside hydrolase [Paraburkholderia aspalathi]MBK3831823.1 nucleoside hydrolase [Paraburkholderia aspalathi]MBK3861530.1 nucleoside hydrolase [Paraburkholderia aspalathi]CAE6767688.1 Pyrimidine-specific ribonucleoside hydrolase RihB [Paraburkholderia aspalathi]CAE6805793.1 Pyrimidine-specific ribonucleoside hydrolase RihB [Paraburkholderia aspalathi]
MKGLFVALTCVASVVAVSALSACGGNDINAQTNPPKVIIDSDYNTLSDDGQLGVMAAQLQAQGSLKVLGITVVSGNQWLKQGVADALKSVERLGVENQIGVYAGANYALSHDFATIQAEQKQFPGGDGYLGAWNTPEPKSDSDLVAPPDGFATHTKLQGKSAVDFIVDSVKQYPGEVTILAIGPLTNIALATRQHPEIVPLIKQIIYMGGAIGVPGNTTPTAEFNWWFDPEAAKTVLRLPIKQVVIPLDVTDTVKMDKALYDRVAHDPNKQTIITQLFKALNGYGFDGKNGFETNPNYTTNIWDTLTLAYLMHPSFATQTVDEWVDVDMSFGANDGKSTGYTSSPPAGLQKMTVVKRFDNPTFFNFYVDLLTRPVPVTLPN